MVGVCLCQGERRSTQRNELNAIELVSKDLQNASFLAGKNMVMKM